MKNDNRQNNPVVILNMAYTGVGIARNLRPLGIPVFGVTGRPGIVGNSTRMAEILFAPDSAEAPRELCKFLTELSAQFAAKPVLFATRDQDVLFCEEYRAELESHYLLPMPAKGVVGVLLDKCLMTRQAEQVGIPVPLTRRLNGWAAVRTDARNLAYPCVVKPITSCEWRGQREWKLIGERKAFAVHSHEELLSEYEAISQVTAEILIQELIPGPDSNLYTFGSYLNRNSELKGSFFGRKLLQSPVGFGTGFVVETAAPSKVEEYSLRLLQSVKYCGVSECEFKLDDRDGELKFIEVNARHWDQHRLSTECGVNLSQLAYFDVCRLPVPTIRPVRVHSRWIAEDSFIYMGVPMVLQKEITWSTLLGNLRGPRVYGWFAVSDPAPFLRWFFRSLVPDSLRRLKRMIWSFFGKLFKRSSTKPANAGQHDKAPAAVR